MFERWTRGVVRYRLLVVAIWVLVAVGGAFAAAKLPALLTTSLDVPGSNSAQANQVLSRQFHDNIEGSFAVVVPSAREESEVPSDVRRAIRVIPGAEVTEQRRVDSTWYLNVDTPLSLGRAAGDTAQLRDALARDGVSNALVTGPPALQHDITPILSSDLARGELITALVALVALMVVFGVSGAIALPFLVAGATMSLALAVLYLLARDVSMVLYVPNIVELFGLGLAMDYSLLIAHRFRHEVGRQASVEDAVVSTVASAGRTVCVSGVVVALALATFILVPVPFVRSLAIGALLVPLAGIASALTLQPALLSLFGRRGVRSLSRRSRASGDGALARRWARGARLALRRPVLVLVVSLVVVAGLGTSLWWLELTPASLSAIPASMSSAKAIRLASDQVGPGFLTPIEVVIDTGEAGGAQHPAIVAARLRLAKAVLGEPGVEVVAIGKRAPYVSASGRYERVFVVTRDQFGALDDQALVRLLRTKLIPAAKFPSAARLYVGGAAAQGVDFLSEVYSDFAWLMALVFVVTYLALARAFRSALLPLVAVALDLLSLAAAYGVLVAVIRFGVGSSILRTYHVSQIEGWVPILIFAVLFGLSMDYEVFLVSRIREHVDRGLETNEAIVRGLSATGGVVSAAALIMVGAMSGFVSGHVAGLQELGVGLGAGIIVDATIVRALILPSVMGLLGRWNWWLPAPLDKVLGTAPSRRG